MKIRAGDSVQHEPCLSAFVIELRWLYAVLRHWQENPGPPAYGGPSPAETAALMEGVALLAILTQDWEEGSARGGNVFEVFPGQEEPSQGPKEGA